MTQAHIRQGAGMRLPQRIWYQLHEPRWVSAFYGLVYVACIIFGSLSGLTASPAMVEAIGYPLVVMASGAVVAGGLIGLVAVIIGAYWAERSAVAMIGVGYGVYLGVTIWLAFAPSHPPRPVFFPILLGLTAIAALVVRWAWIGGREYDHSRDNAKAREIRAAGAAIQAHAIAAEMRDSDD